MRLLYKADAFILRVKIKMYRLKTSAAFDSAHFLKGYNGKCANIHGHHWVIEAEIYGRKLQTQGEKSGMLIDFGDLKKAVRGVAESFDHTLIIQRGTLGESTKKALDEEGFRVTEVDFRPTAENFAKYFYTVLKERDKLQMYSVTVYETPDNCACYGEEI